MLISEKTFRNHNKNKVRNFHSQCLISATNLYSYFEKTNKTFKLHLMDSVLLVTYST